MTAFSTFSAFCKKAGWPHSGLYGVVGKPFSSYLPHNFKVSLCTFRI